MKVATISKKEDLEKTWKKYLKNHSKKELSTLVENYYPFVQRIAYRLSEKLNWHVQPEELASLGIDGLYEAIAAYDPSKNVKFEAYANQRVRGSMIDGLRRQDIVPRSVRMASERFSKHKMDMENHYGRTISDCEFVNMIGMDETSFHKNFRKYQAVLPLSIDNDDDESAVSIKQDSNNLLVDCSYESPETALCRKEFFSKLFGRDCNKIERTIAYLYYYKGYTMDSISKSVNLSESRVSQIHKKILKKLKKRIERNPDYFNKDIYSFIAK
jgi:RNA polymerase sigma factor for flagellar operon FliA